MSRFVLKFKFESGFEEIERAREPGLHGPSSSFLTTPKYSLRQLNPSRSRLSLPQKW